MILNLKGFSQLIQDMGAALQSSASALIDVSVGSVIRAIFEANASVVLWLQWLVLQVLQTTRASTSNGPDLDTWMLDFGQTRLPAIAATGLVTFSRYVSTLSVSIPIGAIVKTSDGQLSFSVTSDQSLSIWSPSASAYVLPAGVGSADVPVMCTTGGSAGNIMANMLTIIAASLPGIDQVNNANPLSNGKDAESDAAFRGRFQTYLASRSRATLAAIRNAIANVQQSLNFTVIENTGANGNVEVGSFLVIIDDGTGYPSSALLANVSSAIDLVRPIGTTFAVLGPNVLPVSVSLNAVLSPNADTSSISSAVQTYVANYLNTLPVGGPASVTRVAQNAYLGGSGILNVTAVLLNGSSADVSVLPGTVIKAGQITVTTNDG